MAQTNTIAVLVPGILGSRLLKQGDPLPVWPDQVLANPDSAAALLSQPGLTAGAPIENLVKPGLPPTTVAIYSGLIDYFSQQNFAYVTQNGTLPDSGDVLVGFGYDWRQPNGATAAALDSLLNDVAAQYGPGAQIWLIAHSMGGLVSRYLLESGMAQGAPWTVQGLITLGTPHLGAPLALSAITGQADLTDLLSPDVIEQVVDIPAYPSAFELLPPPQITFVTDSAGNGYSIYSGPVNTLLTAAAPIGYGAPESSFQDAQTFFSGLDYDGSQDGRPPYNVVYGSSAPNQTPPLHPTTVSFTYDASASLPSGNPLAPYADLYGDEVVPEWSASFGLVQPDGTSYPPGWVSQSYDAVGVSHDQLPSNPGVLQQIGKWMGITGQPSATGREAAIAAAV